MIEIVMLCVSVRAVLKSRKSVLCIGVSCLRNVLEYMVHTCSSTVFSHHSCLLYTHILYFFVCVGCVKKYAPPRDPL